MWEGGRKEGSEERGGDLWAGEGQIAASSQLVIGSWVMGTIPFSMVPCQVGFPVLF